MGNGPFVALREALLQEWDPIGVREIEEARDEYDAYAAPISELLRRRVSVDEICAYLRHVEVVGMGLNDTPEARDRARRFAESITQRFAPTD